MPECGCTSTQLICNSTTTQRLAIHALHTDASVQVDKLLTGLKAEPPLCASLVAQDLTDCSLGDANVVCDGTLSPIGIKKVADQRFPVHAEILAS